MTASFSQILVTSVNVDADKILGSLCRPLLRFLSPYCQHLARIAHEKFLDKNVSPAGGRFRGRRKPALSSAACYAAAAIDSASDPVYADGWQGRMVNAAGVPVIPAGDNGGFGFTPWNFTSSVNFWWHALRLREYGTFHAIDDGLQGGTHYSNPFNNIGRAWDIGIATPTDKAFLGPAAAFLWGSARHSRLSSTIRRARQFFKGYRSV